jgi:methyl-accepting chemotaxis protein
MKMRNMGVATRLGLGFGVVSLLLMAIIALALSSMSQIQQRLDDITKVNDVETRLAATMDLTVTERALALRNLILLKEAKEIQIEVDRLSAQAKKYAAAQEKLGQMFTMPGTSAEEKDLLEQIRKQGQLALPFIDKAAALALEQKQDDAYQLLRYQFRPVQKAWWDLLRQLIAVEEKQNDTATADAAAAYAAARSQMLVIGALALLASLTAALLITRGVVRQLGCEPDEAAAIAGQIAAGNLSIAIEPRPGDDHSLLHAMKSMRDSLALIVSQVHSSTETIATAAGQIASGNLDLSSRTEQQAGTLEETASSMEELTSTVRINSDHARAANGLAVSASDVAERGGAVVAQVVDTMAAIDHSAHKIGDIIAVIDGIAFQTNILALNAAVEAARAGEQGRGFAVVATEVRNLAQRSAAAAKEIKELVGDSVNKVEAGNRLVEQAGSTMHEVVHSVRRVTEIMSEIMAASQEQSSGIEQINQAVMQMDSVTQQNAALVEEAAAAAEAMREQANNLTEVVGIFRLEAQSGRPLLPSAPTVQALPKPVAPATRVATKPAPARRALTANGTRKAAAPADAEWEQF